MTPRPMPTTTYTVPVHPEIQGNDLGSWTSDQMKKSLVQLRSEIAALERQIEERQRAASNPRTNLLNLSSELYGLQEMIKQKRALIESIQIQLRTAEMVEKAAANIEAQAQAKAAEAERLEIEQREATARAAALSAWIDANGSPAGFEGQWPTIKRQIATEAAQAAAATSLESGGVDQANMTAHVTKILQTLYGGVNVNKS